MSMSTPSGSKEVRNYKNVILLGFLFTAAVLQVFAACTWLFSSQGGGKDAFDRWGHIACWAGVISIFKAGFLQVSKPVFFYLITKRRTWSRDDHEQRVQRAADAFYKTLFHLISLFIWYAVLGKEPWSGNFISNWSLDPALLWDDRHNVSEDVKWWFTFATGYMVSEFLVLIPDRQRSDFYEMSIHHTIGIGLMVFAQLYGFMKIGSLVMFVNNISDLFVFLSRTTVDINLTVLVAFCYLKLVLSFLWFRLYIFPCVLLRSCVLDSIPHIAAEEKGAYLYFIVTLCILQVLYWYWWCLILRAGWNFAKTGQARDLVQNLSLGNLGANFHKRNSIQNNPNPQKKKK